MSIEITNGGTFAVITFEGECYMRLEFMISFVSCAWYQWTDKSWDLTRNELSDRLEAAFQADKKAFHEEQAQETKQ